jgi:hypothetical protein
VTLTSGLVGSEAGWGFNCRDGLWDYVPDFTCLTNSGLDKTEALAKINTPEQLKLKSFFAPFREIDLYSDDATLASDTALEFKDHTLAYGIPALSHAAGSTKFISTGTPIKNFDMNDVMKDSNKAWPAERAKDDNKWLHSDAKDISYRYVYKLFDTWVKEVK